MRHSTKSVAAEEGGTFKVNVKRIRYANESNEGGIGIFISFGCELYFVQKIKSSAATIYGALLEIKLRNLIDKKRFSAT